MLRFIRETPFALSGVMLGCVSIGNLLGIQNYIGFLVAAFLLLLSSKFMLFFPDFLKELQNSVMTSITGTFTLTLMLFSLYLKPWLGAYFSLGLWYLAIILHIGLIIFFTCRFMPKQKVSDLHASYFIVYIGLIIASLTAPQHQACWLGEIFFWFSLPFYLGLIGPIVYRYIRYSQMPDLQKPLICIITAPPNLSLAAYLQLKVGEGTEPLSWVVGFLAVLSLISYVGILTQLPRLIKPKVFFPSYAAFTFPFVISALASRSLYQYLGEEHSLYILVQGWFYFQEIIAILLVSFTLLRYFQSLLHYLLVDRHKPVV